MDGEDVSSRQGVLSSLLLDFNVFPLVRSQSQDAPKKAKKSKRATKNSAVMRFLADRIFPEYKANRVYLQRELLGPVAPVVRESEKDTSSDRLFQIPPPVSFADIPWLDKLTRDPTVRHRIEMLQNALKEEFPPAAKKIKIEATSCLCTPGSDRHKCSHCQSQESGYRTSLGTSFGTPSFTTASVSTPLQKIRSPDPATKQRISDLEQTVQLLKEQITNMVSQMQLNQSVSTGTPGPPPVPTAPGGPPPPRPPPCAPPPPPPPPPPIAPAKQMMSVTEIIKQTKAKNGKSEDAKPKDGTPQGSFDMREVLKGLGTVKLKTVPRSPGGTPLKAEALPCEVNDHASVFARALKRKFSLCPIGSPDSDKENTPPGPHLLKKMTASRRLLRRSKPLANVTNS